MNPETLKVLEKWAEDEFRSLNGQIEFLLHKAIKDQRRSKLKNDPEGMPDQPAKQGEKTGK